MALRYFEVVLRDDRWYVRPQGTKRHHTGPYTSRERAQEIADEINTIVRQASERIYRLLIASLGT